MWSISNLSFSKVACATLLLLAWGSLSVSSDPAVPLCHVDINRFSGKSTSTGSWAGIEYNIVYSLGTCTSDAPEGTLSAVLNGESKTITARSGEIVFDGLAVVKFSVEANALGDQLFSSSLCWSESSCTQLCSAVSLGVKGPCEVEKTVMPTMIATLWLLPIIACGCFLLVLYVRKRNDERLQALEAIRSPSRTPQAMRGPTFPPTSDESTQREEASDGVSVRIDDPPPCEVTFEEDTQSVINAESMERISIITEEDTIRRMGKKEIRTVLGNCAINGLVNDEAKRRAEIQKEEESERRSCTNDRDKALNDTQAFYRKMEQLTKDEEEARNAIVNDESDARNALKKAEAAEKEMVIQYEQECSRVGDELKKLLKEELQQRRQIEDEQNDAMDEIVERAVADCQEITNKQLIEALVQEEQDKRDAIEDEANDAFNDMLSAEAEELHEVFSGGMDAIQKEEKAERDSIAKEEQADFAKIADLCSDEKKKIEQALQKAAEEALNANIKALEQQERDERDAIEDEEKDGLNDIMSTAAEELHEVFAHAMDDIQKEEKTERDAIAKEEQRELSDIDKLCSDEKNQIEQAQEEAFIANVNALEQQERDERDAIEDEANDAFNDMLSAEAEELHEVFSGAMDAIQKEEKADRDSIAKEEQADFAKIADLCSDEKKQVEQALQKAAEEALNANIKDLEQQERDDRDAIEDAEKDGLNDIMSAEADELHKVFADAMKDIQKEEKAERDAIADEEKKTASAIRDQGTKEKDALQQKDDLADQESQDRAAIEEEEKSARMLISAKSGPSLRRAKANEAARNAASLANLEKDEERARDDVAKEEAKERQDIATQQADDHEKTLAIEDERAMEDVLAATRTYSYTDEYKELMRQNVGPAKNLPPPPPFIGFSLAEVVKEGVLMVDGLYKDGPAYQTGIRIGDKLLRIEGVEVRTIDDARDVVTRRCRCGRVTPITLISPENKQYTVALWIMTADRQHMGQPYFFDVRKHERIESDVKKTVVEGPELLETPRAATSTTPRRSRSRVESTSPSTSPAAARMPAAEMRERRGHHTDSTTPSRGTR